MKQRNVLFGAAIVFGLTALGCDQAGLFSSGNTVQSRVVIDLSALKRTASDGGQHDCFWVADELRVTVDGKVQCQEPIEPNTSSVACSVEARIGTVAFKAEILGKKNDVPLYAANTTVEVEQDGYEIILDLTRQNPVMQWCERSNMITNRGIGTLTWSVQPVSNPCNLTFPSLGNSLSAGESKPLIYEGISLGFTGACIVNLVSSQGDIQLCACLSCGNMLESICCDAVRGANLNWPRCTNS